MSFWDNLKKKLEAEPEKDNGDYFKRNSGKKVMATILEPTEAEIKNKEIDND